MFFQIIGCIFLMYFLKKFWNHYRDCNSPWYIIYTDSGTAMTFISHGFIFDHKIDFEEAKKIVRNYLENERKMITCSIVDIEYTYDWKFNQSAPNYDREKMRSAFHDSDRICAAITYFEGYATPPQKTA